MKQLKVYWGKDKITIVEPSGKIHQSDKNTVDGKNLIDLMFMKKYVGQVIDLYMTDRGTVPINTVLTKVDIQDCGVHYFEVT